MNSPVAGYPLPMKRNPWLWPAVAVAALPILAAGPAGCGSPPPVRSAPIGANVTAETIDVDNALIDPPPEGESYDVHESAVLRFAVFNHGGATDELKSIDSDVATEVELHWDQNCNGSAEPTPTLPVRAGGTVPPPMGEGPVQGTVYYATLDGLTEELRQGTTVPLVFEFERAGVVPVAAPVLTGEDGNLPPLGCHRR
jgi:copper(I)-binding protein